ncbi:MAG: hypothetical protein GX971_13545 [Firmicutes bacterium]|nr:hypothetical protein [Bacillota bacterium]
MLSPLYHLAEYSFKLQRDLLVLNKLSLTIMSMMLFVLGFRLTCKEVLWTTQVNL